MKSKEEHIPIIATITTIVIVFVFLLLSQMVSAQSGTMYYKSGLDFHDVTQGQFRFEVKNDTLWILEDYVYEEDNKKKRFTNYWGERITAKAKCDCIYYTEYNKYTFTLSNNEFVTCLYEPIIGSNWYYRK